MYLWEVVSQVIFWVVTLGFGFLVARRVSFIRRAIRLGQRPFLVRGTRVQRLKRMLLLAFGQQKMFQKPVPALLHLLVYVGFLLINLEVLEIFLDGVLGTHRILLPVLKGSYVLLINFFEALMLGVAVACALFLARRHLLRVRRLSHADLKGFPKRDADIILLAEIALMLMLFCMNASDQLLQQRVFNSSVYAATGEFFLSQHLFVPFLSSYSDETLFFLERSTWWAHWVGILSFALYITYSKHLHIFMAFPNTYFTSVVPLGAWENMESVRREVLAMQGDTGGVAADTSVSAATRFGARDVQDLSWKHVMDAFSCTECGRCTSQCPAHLTGKKLSPRKIMMQTRACAEDVNKGESKGVLLDEYISREEVNACTTCMACIEACPVSINPMDILVHLRQYAMMEESKAPAAWNEMVANIEASQSPWKFPHAERFRWSEEA